MFIMSSQVQALLSLISGSTVCCSDIEEGTHDIKVTHPSGRVDNYSLSTKFEVGVEMKKKWSLFGRSKLSVDVLNFTQLRQEANRVLKYFIKDPVPYVSDKVDISIIPDFWRAVVPLQALPRSRAACYQYLGRREKICMQDILCWKEMRRVGEARSDVFPNAKSPHKSLLIVIIEIGNYLSRHYEEMVVGDQAMEIECGVQAGELQIVGDIEIEVCF